MENRCGVRVLATAVLLCALASCLAPGIAYASAKAPHVSVWVSSTRPVQSTVVTSTIKFTTGAGRVIRNARVVFVWKSRTFSKSATIRTNAAGLARCSFDIGEALTGAKITVKATATLGRKPYAASCAFVPQPRPWVLSTPQSAVRSYLDWTSFAYRLQKASVARPTMSAAEFGRVKDYISYLSGQGRFMDMTLDSITFGAQSVDGSDTLVPAHEHWTYRYASPRSGKTVAGPYTASYDSTYTVTQPDTDWIVDSVQATAVGKVN
jgi:hypothetical protein